MNMTTKEEYFAIIDQEEGEQLAYNIIEEVLVKGQEVLFEKHIESQVLPYAVQFAKETLLRIVEWEFFNRDPGEIDLETWLPDEEPQPAIIDSWARGAIPTRKPPPPLPTPVKKVMETSTPTTASRTSLVSASGIGKTSTAQAPPPAKASAMSLTGSTKDGKKRSANSLASNSSNKIGSRTGFPRPSSSRKGVLNNGIGDEQLSAAAAAEHAIIEENKRTLNRIETIEKEGGKAEFSYDNEGRLVTVKKVAPHKLLTQGVRVKVVQEDPQPPQPQQPPQNKQTQGTDLTASRLHILNRLHAPEKAPKQQPVDTMSKRSLSRTTVQMGSMSSVASVGGANGGFVPDLTLDIPLLADTMRLAPGVVLKEGEVVKRGPAPIRKVKDFAYDYQQSSAVSAVDPILAQVLNKAKPTLKSIPFPVVGARGNTTSPKPDGVENSRKAYKKLPDIRAEEKVETSLHAKRSPMPAQ
ncbi:hypothetical protein HDV05_004484 [Chytridiales sp. JEL 0842]|nr:hypothetical protein HDV05_004484 [Chytridiales sp. JEL 0842]